ncbi:MAG: transposase [Bacteriovoracaceae bacterium]|nr:transposase [Bacteriovoracaceae bacterium]
MTEYNKRTYTEGFKKSAVEKLLSQSSLGLTGTATKVGVSPSTLYSWKKKYANTYVMGKIKNKTAKKWTPEQKLEAVIQTSSMTDQELGEYLRSNGLHTSDLEGFKSVFLELPVSKGRPKLDTEVKELRKQEKQLKRELRQAQVALARQSARIILLKKSHEIWGTIDDEDDE